MVCRTVFAGLLTTALALAACAKEEEPPPTKIKVEPADRSCEESEQCVAVETSCVASGCECGIAVNQAHAAKYKEMLAACREGKDLETCDFQCETPFTKCFRGACVLTKEPQEVFRRGKGLSDLCASTGGEFTGCPECPPGKVCKACVPCDCPPRHRWYARSGCRIVVKTESDEIQVRARPAKARPKSKMTVVVKNNAKRAIRLVTTCKTPLSNVRQKEDGWEVSWSGYYDRKCRRSTIRLKPGKSRRFATRNLRRFKSPSGEPLGAGTYRFELHYTEDKISRRHSGIVYSNEFEYTP